MTRMATAPPTADDTQGSVEQKALDDTPDTEGFAEEEWGQQATELKQESAAGRVVVSVCAVLAAAAAM